MLVKHVVPDMRGALPAVLQVQAHVITCAMCHCCASSQTCRMCNAQDVHGALLARVQAQALGGGPDSVARLPVALREAAWVEAADCFTAMLPGQQARSEWLYSLEGRRWCCSRLPGWGS